MGSQERGHGYTKRSTLKDLGRAGRSTPLSPPEVPAEMSVRGIKCFDCHKRGHIAKHCPNSKGQPRTPVQGLSTATEDNTEEKQESEGIPNEQMWKWTRILSTSNSDQK